jgi:tRNA-dihydrouridine synthase C
MEGVTDAPMRAILTERGAFTFCVSEFLRVSHMVPPRHVVLRHVPELMHGAKTPAGTPVSVQLLGGDPEKMARAAEIARDAGAPAIDLNFGCPAKTVNRHDGGATLLKYPDRIERIVAAVRAAVPGLPVSAKLRLGWEARGDIHRNAEAAAKGGAHWLTIHARTKEQGYAPPVFWKPAGEVRRALGIPVVANGDIWTLDDFRRCREETGLEHFMIGRGAVSDPNLAAGIARELGLPFRQAPLLVAGSQGSDWLPLLERFAELCGSASSCEGYTVRRIKQWLGQADRRGSFQGFDRIKRTQSLRELMLALDEPANFSSCTL